MMEWSCRHCDFTKETPDDHKAVFHSCKGPKPRRRRISVGAETYEERRSALFAALAGAVGEEALYRRSD